TPWRASSLDSFLRCVLQPGLEPLGPGDLVLVELQPVPEHDRVEPGRRFRRIGPDRSEVIEPDLPLRLERADERERIRWLESVGEKQLEQSLVAELVARDRRPQPIHPRTP